jgi:hypothetical protein
VVVCVSSVLLEKRRASLDGDGKIFASRSTPYDMRFRSAGGEFHVPLEWKSMSCLPCVVANATMNHAIDRDDRDIVAVSTTIIQPTQR